MLYFSVEIWYNYSMKSTKEMQTSNAEMVTISRAEYEEFQAQRQKISELESRVDLLMEALRLARHKQFGASSEKSEDALMEQLSFLFNEAEVFSAARWQPISGTRSMNTPWTTSPRASRPSRWSTVWRVRILFVPSVEIP